MISETFFVCKSIKTFKVQHRLKVYIFENFASTTIDSTSLRNMNQSTRPLILHFLSLSRTIDNLVHWFESLKDQYRYNSNIVHPSLTSPNGRPYGVSPRPPGLVDEYE